MIEDLHDVLELLNRSRTRHARYEQARHAARDGLREERFHACSERGIATAEVDVDSVVTDVTVEQRALHRDRAGIVAEEVLAAIGEARAKQFQATAAAIMSILTSEEVRP